MWDKSKRVVTSVLRHFGTCICLVALIGSDLSVFAWGSTSASSTNFYAFSDADSRLITENSDKDIKKGNSGNLVQFCNSSPMTGGTTASPFSPYPSDIPVSGFSGNITDISVTLIDVNHSWSSDIDVLLVGPTGATLVLMSDVGLEAGFDTTATVTISDSAAALFPTTATGIPTGSYRPTNGGAGDVFDVPAPAGPHNNPAPAGISTFNGIFGGTVPNGTWSLYVMDDTGLDSGSFGGGWCIDIAAASVQGALSFSSAAYGSDEGDGTATITVNRLSGTTGAVSVDYSTSDGTAAGNISCLVSGADYLNNSGTLMWAAGDGAAKTFDVSICTDLFSEDPAETANLALSNPLGGATIGVGAAVLSVTDAATVHRDPTPIVIPDFSFGEPGQVMGSVTVSGETLNPGRVRVTLFDLEHTFPDDLDVLLVAPDGSTFVLMGDAGGASDVTGVTLTFEDAAPTLLPDTTILTSGNFQPANYLAPVTDFAPPAPAGPYNEPGNSFAELVGFELNGVFTGNPNGVWSLFVRDEVEGDTGIIAGGFGIDFLGVTAAPATISGRAVSANGRPLRNVSIRILGGGLAEPLFTRTNSFGFFKFDGIPTGDTYILSAFGKQVFANPDQIITVNDNLSGIEFIGNY